jgi:hypothetical protein
MVVLNPTPPDRLVNPQNRPYFLWDENMTLEAFVEALRDSDPTVRGYFAGKLMRQAKPDDVFTSLGLDDIRALWGHIEPPLGQTRAFWSWLLARWA